jgi:predicted membrane protein
MMLKIEFLWARIALVLIGLAMAISYSMNMLVNEEPGWIWNHPSRNMAMEHMLVAVYVTMGVFLIWSVRNPLKAAPLIDFVIVSGAIYGATMFIDANAMLGHMVHNELGGDVFGTFLAPITLLLTHPRCGYIFEKKAVKAEALTE